MALNYELRNEDDHLLVVLEGETESVSEMLDYVDSFVNECRQVESGLVMLDHRKLDFNLDMASAYDLAVQCIDRMDTNAVDKIALVVKPERVQTSGIFETISVNQGVDLKVFDRMKMASSWLRG